MNKRKGEANKSRKPKSKFHFKGHTCAFMIFDDLKLILTQCGIETEHLKPRSPTQVQVSCPLAPYLHSSRSDSRPSLSIRFNDATQWTVYKCWSCKSAGRIADLVHSLYGFTGKDKLFGFFVGQFIDAKDGQLERYAWFVQPSYKFTLPFNFKYANDHRLL